METKSFEFPYALKNAIKGLDNDLRWKILEYLVEVGETPYSKLLKELKIKNKGILTFHLRELSKSGIIDRFELLGSDTNGKSFYDVSHFGRNVINGLMSALLPKQKLLDQSISREISSSMQTIFPQSTLFPGPVAPSVSQMRSKLKGRKQA